MGAPTVDLRSAQGAGLRPPPSALRVRLRRLWAEPPRGFGVASAPRRSKPVQQLTQHAFDAPRFKTPVRFGQAQTTRHCQLREVAGGRAIAMTILASKGDQPSPTTLGPLPKHGGVAP